jgi:hypothetical protein
VAALFQWGITDNDDGCVGDSPFLSLVRAKEHANQLVGSGSHDCFLQSLSVSIFSACQHLFSKSASFQY